MSEGIIVQGLECPNCSMIDSLVEKEVDVFLCRRCGYESDIDEIHREMEGGQ